MKPILDHPIISARYFFPRPSAPPNGVTVEVEGARLACARVEFDHDPMPRGTIWHLVRPLRIAASCTLVLVALSVAASCNAPRSGPPVSTEVVDAAADVTAPESSLVPGGECDTDRPMIHCETTHLCLCEAGEWVCSPQASTYEDPNELVDCYSSDYCNVTFEADEELVCMAWMQMGAAYVESGQCECPSYPSAHARPGNAFPIEEFPDTWLPHDNRGQFSWVTIDAQPDSMGTDFAGHVSRYLRGLTEDGAEYDGRPPHSYDVYEFWRDHSHIEGEYTFVLEGHNGPEPHSRRPSYVVLRDDLQYRPITHWIEVSAMGSIPREHEGDYRLTATLRHEPIEDEAP